MINRGKDVEVISTGSFVDLGYIITTTVIRLFGDLKKEYLRVNRQPDCLDYIDDLPGLNQALADMQEQQEAWQRRVQAEMGIIGKPDDFSFTVHRNKSEIFTAIYMEPVKAVQS